MTPNTTGEMLVQIQPCTPITASQTLPIPTSNLDIINSLYNLFCLYLQAEAEPTKMTYYEPSEWDETTSEVEKYEEDAGESVLRNERDIILSRMNHGIQQVHLELNNII